MLANFPDEYRQHQKFGDWSKCFIKKSNVFRWAKDITQHGRIHGLPLNRGINGRTGLSLGKYKCHETIKAELEGYMAGCRARSAEIPLWLGIIYWNFSNS